MSNPPERPVRSYLGVDTRSSSDDLPDRGREAAAALRAGAPLPPGELALLLDQLAGGLDAAKRQVVRLGLDLHDEGLQLMVALGADLHLFRAQLAEVLEGSDYKNRSTGRVDDLLARVTALDAVLRDVAASAQASSILRRPLEETLRELADPYGDICTFVFDLQPGLDSIDLTETQTIALVRVVQSALANVAQHSEATTATVTVRYAPETIEADIFDDGRGFGVEQTLADAHAEGRLGLEGMRRRIELLGGEFVVESSEGGPTRVLARLPRGRFGTAARTR